MKKLTLLSVCALYTCILSAQPSFQTSLEAGISLPLNSNDVNGTHAGKAINFGNHLDYSFGNGAVKVGLGAYIGYINSIAEDNSYKQVGESLAEKYRFSPAALVFNSSSFKSTQILVGPVASFGSAKLHVNVWAKGGYGLNEPARYSVVDKENGAVNNVYSSQAGDNKNGLAYNLGAGVVCALSPYVGLKLSAGYFSTQTDQVNYNFDRDKGTTPLYYTAANQFIQATAGLQFTIGKPGRKGITAKSDPRATVDKDDRAALSKAQKIKTKSNIKNDRVINNPADNGSNNTGDPLTTTMVLKIKTKSNIKNDRLANNSNNNAGNAGDDDSLFFSPEKIELRSMMNNAAGNSTQLLAVDNYLTGFVYQAQQGTVISQCGANAMPGDPVPGIDVRLRQAGAAANDAVTARTNRDGSFAFNNIAPGNYTAEAGSEKINITVNQQNAFKTLDLYGGSCSNIKENYIINDGDKTYVEVINTESAAARKHPGNVKYSNFKINAREAGSGLATGKRMHKPFRVADTDFDVNWNNIVQEDGKLYAEVMVSREASSGMATGRSTIVTGDLDGDGIDDNAVIAPGDAAPGMITSRKHIAGVKYQDRVISPRDASSGLATGKRMHKPYVITKELNADGDEVIQVEEIAIDEPGVQRTISPRDAASGLPTGKRMHKPFVITKELNFVDLDSDNDAIASREAATGLATGRRMHKPFVVRINPDEDTYEIISPRDATTGMPASQRMHKPFVVTKELDYTDDGGEVVSYKIIHRDLAARNVLPADEDDNEEKMAITEQGTPKKKGQKKDIITGKDNDNGMYAERDAASGLATGRKFNKNAAEIYEPLNDDAAEEAASSPLYEQGGNHGVNPLYEAKTDLRVAGSNGKGHHVFIPANLLVDPGTQTAFASFNEYKVGPIKWMSPESMAARKGIQEKGIKKNDAAAKKGIQEKGIKKSASPGNAENDAYTKGMAGSSKNINTSEDNLKGQAVIKTISRVRCADGICAVEAIVEVDGVEYEAVVSGVLKGK